MRAIDQIDTVYAIIYMVNYKCPKSTQNKLCAHLVYSFTYVLTKQFLKLFVAEEMKERKLNFLVSVLELFSRL